MTELTILDEDRSLPATTDKYLADDKNLSEGRRYRFEHLSMPVVLGDMAFGKDDPGPGDRIPRLRPDNFGWWALPVSRPN